MSRIFDNQGNEVEITPDGLVMIYNPVKLTWNEIAQRIMKVAYEEVSINYNLITKFYYLKIAYGERTRDSINTFCKTEEQAYEIAIDYLNQVESK